MNGKVKLKSIWVSPMGQGTCLISIPSNSVSRDRDKNGKVKFKSISVSPMGQGTQLVSKPSNGVNRGIIRDRDKNGKVKLKSILVSPMGQGTWLVRKPSKGVSRDIIRDRDKNEKANLKRIWLYSLDQSIQLSDKEIESKQRMWRHSYSIRWHSCWKVFMCFSRTQIQLLQLYSFRPRDYVSLEKNALVKNGLCF